jgi:hypothetical protein
MSDLPTKPLDRIFEALGPWPIVQFAAAALIIFFVLKAMGRGEKDRKTNGNGDGTPRWFANEQTLEVLRDIKGELRQHTQLLEQIANENVINPRRLQE